MKRFLLFASGVFAVVVMLFLANEMLNAAMCKHSEVGDERMEKADRIRHLFRELDNEEIPILGSSRAGAYVPSVISERCRGYSFSGSRLKETLFQLGKVLSARKEGLVIVNIDPWGAMGYDEPFVAIYDLVADDTDVRANVSDASGNFVASMFPYAFRFKRNLQNLIQASKRRRLVLVRQSDATGVPDAEWARMDATVKPWYFEKNDEAVAQLKDVLDRQGENKIAWVVSPIEPHKREMMQNAAAMMDFLGIAASRRGNYVFDFFTDASVFTRADFVDPNHLNREGGIKFSKLLYNSLVAEGLLNN